MPDGYPLRRTQTPGRPQMSQRDIGLTRQFLRPGAAPRRRRPGATPTGPVSPMYSSPVNFSQTPAGRAVLQRVLQQYTGRRGMGPRRPMR
jgi:hypothetical protein